MNYYLGMDVGGTNIKALLVDENYSILMENIAPTFDLNSSRTGEIAIENMISVIKKIIINSGIKESQISAICAGLPGLVDTRRNIAVRMSSIPWRNTDVAGKIQQAINVPVFLENDGTVNLMGERYFGAGKNCDNIILITLGTGVGGAVLIDGIPLEGYRGFAAELGHIIINHDGIPCRCNARGCFQAYCSAAGIVEYAANRMEEEKSSLLWKLADYDKTKVTTYMISEGYDKDDLLCQEVITHTSGFLSDALTSYIYIFNPELILLAGGVSEMGERLLKPVRARVRANLMIEEQMCRIEQAGLGRMAGAYGACYMAFLRLQKYNNRYANRKNLL